MSDVMNNETDKEVDKEVDKIIYKRHIAKLAKQIGPDAVGIYIYVRTTSNGKTTDEYYNSYVVETSNIIIRISSGEEWNVGNHIDDYIEKTFEVELDNMNLALGYRKVYLLTECNGPNKHAKIFMNCVEHIV